MIHTYDAYNPVDHWVQVLNSQRKANADHVATEKHGDGTVTMLFEYGGPDVFVTYGATNAQGDTCTFTDYNDAVEFAEESSSDYNGD